jgi:DNA-binding winged helix-turn-helix (wHTH) protein/dipeptidyl aminopeptidase/acylaminoacyl peptidase
MSVQTPHSYEFGNFRLDTKEKILFRDNQPIALRPKVFETLLVFVEHAGRLLEKDEVMQTIWKDQFVEESNLTFNIKMLRRVLNDDAHQPRFIETVPRRGYRFIAEVKAGFNHIPIRTETSQTALKPNRSWKRRSIWIAAFALLLLTFVALVVRFARSNRTSLTSSAPILSKPFKSEKLINLGTDVRAAISPDGKYVAYTNETGGKESIWLRQLATAENIQIVPPTDEQYLGLVISHDGNSLYFVRKTRTDPPTAAIYRVMTFGGIPVKIAEKTEGAVSLSPDDRQLSFMRCNYRDDDFCSLLTVDANGQNERRLLTRKRPNRLAGAQFSPDGRSIAFASGQSDNGGSGFRLLLLDLAIPHFGDIKCMVANRVCIA